MDRAEFFDHTADVGLRVHAASLNALFRLAAESLFDFIVINRKDVASDTVETMSINAPDLPELFAEWLGELLFRFETEHRLYIEFNVEVCESDQAPSLEAILHSVDLENDPARFTLDHEVKAVTRHGLLVEQIPDGWLAEVILDI